MMSRIHHRLMSLLVCCMICGAAVSCMKEVRLNVETDFGYEIDGDYNTTPVTIIIENRTTGADQFEWTFEGGKPASSSEKEPGQVLFTTPGEHRVTLRAWNHDMEKSMQQVIRVDPAVTVDFGYQILVNDFAPALVTFTNRTKGALSYEWTFEGGTPATSTLAAPGAVRFDTEGEHKITLTANNGSETFTTEQTVTLQPTLAADFTMAPLIDDGDMEAPFTVVVRNASRSSVSVMWRCEGGQIADLTGEQTTIYFALPGTYTVAMTADNLKEQRSAQHQITVAPNSGLYTITDLQFGINQAKNTVGCLFSGDLRRVLTSSEIGDEATGAKIDIGFFALNSAFDHCYFFSPDKAEDSAFPAIPGAISTQVNNDMEANRITQATFEQITSAADMTGYNYTQSLGNGNGDEGNSFALDTLPVFVFFRTQDGRRGIVMIKEAVGAGAGSYAVADIKIEKRVR